MVTRQWPGRTGNADDSEGRVSVPAWTGLILITVVAFSWEHIDLWDCTALAIYTTTTNNNVLFDALFLQIGAHSQLPNKESKHSQNI